MESEQKFAIFNVNKYVRELALTEKKEVLK